MLPTGSPTTWPIRNAIPFSPSHARATSAARFLRAHRTRRELRRDLRGLRAHHPPGHHALEPSRLLRVLRHHRQRARRARGVPLGRAQRAGDALAHVAGGDRARRGHARVAAPVDRPSERVRGGHLRHRVRLDASCARGRAGGRRSGCPPRGTRRAIGSPDHSGLLLASTRTRRSTRRSSCSASDTNRVRPGACGCRVPDEARCACRRDRADRRNGAVPLAIVATVGTTSTTSIDPVEAIAAIAERERVWLHVDAAYAGVAAMLPDYAVDPARRRARRFARRQSRTSGCSRRSISACSTAGAWTRLRTAFSLTPEYLQDVEAAPVKNLMDTGVQLGRRFRALKLWMVVRHFGAEGLRESSHRTHSTGQDVRSGGSPSIPISRSRRPCRSAWCASARNGSDELNERLLDRVNASGEVFLSHTRLDGRFVLRLAIGNLRTTESHVARAWALIQQHAHELAKAG